MDVMRFDGKVVLVTGAGAGLGREYALEFAKRGASVVVNDLGSNIDGSGSQGKVADSVVEEIRAFGGKAAANYDSVEYGEKLVQTALDNFGRIDIVINNAGILRDRSFGRMTEAEWDIIHKIHLKSAFSVTKAAWDHMKKQKFGRVILTASPSGLYGNFGQANYSAAKMGLVGFGNTVAIEGRKHNILVNTIAPTAFTRLTEGLMPQEMLQEMKPEYIMPLVIYLCHDSFTDTGGVYELVAGYICKLRWQRSQGAVLREMNKLMTPEAVRDNWNAVTNFDNPRYVEDIGSANMIAVEAITRIHQGDNDLGSNHPIKPKLAREHKFEKITSEHDAAKVILYALGIGCKTTEADYLKFLYENSPDFSVIPSFGVIPSFECIMNITGAPGLEIDPTQILHGEQYLELYKPIPTKAKLTHEMKVVDVLDKGSGAAIVTDIISYDEQGDKVFYNQFVTFVVGAGGFHGQRSSSALKAVAKNPQGPPEKVIEEATSASQAALYRLSGDPNPLHIDPAFAAMGGFKEPILHGLCSFGHATRHVMKAYADNDTTKIKAIKVRFAKPVLPGQTLRTEMWQRGSRIHFRTICVETDQTCLTGAYIDLHETPVAKL